jgi:transposase
VAKAPVDVAVRPTGGRWTIPTTEAGRQEVLARLVPLRPTLVLVDAAGGLELPLVADLAAAALPVLVVTPCQGRDCATATGPLAQPDAWDVRALAHLAEAIRPLSRPLPDAATQALTARLVAEKNRLSLAAPALRPPLQAPLTWLAHELQALEQDRGPDRTPEPRVGGARRSVAARRLGGGAPFNRDSGTLGGKRTVWGGRARVRGPRSMAARVASRHNPVIRAFSQRRCAKGTPKQVALTACRRKLWTMLTAIVNQRSRWPGIIPQARCS